MNHTKGQVYPDGTVAYYKDAKAREMISTDYDSTASYAVGDYCMYDNVRYCCNTAIGSGGETWNSSHWDEAKVDDDVTEIKSSLSDLLFQGAGKVTNLNLLDRTKGVIYINTYDAGATNAPNSNNGGYLFTFVNTDSANYGIQVSVTNGGIHARRLQGGSYQTWVVIVSV